MLVHLTVFFLIWNEIIVYLGDDRCIVPFSFADTLRHAAVVFGDGFFSWGTKFKYTGRTEREILTESINALRKQKMTNSEASKCKASSVPATPSSPQGDLAQICKLLPNSYIASDDYKHLSLPSGYSSLPRSTMSECRRSIVRIFLSIVCCLN
uniref:FERM adjacent domain-containing protein n=1 Tax=Glossina morsitans morsitans TaxID=37546 RepID=A0A1B0F9T7_GLOMM